MSNLFAFYLFLQGESELPSYLIVGIFSPRRSRLTLLQKPTIASTKKDRQNLTAAAIDEIVRTDPLFTATTPLPGKISL